MRGESDDFSERRAERAARRATRSGNTGARRGVATSANRGPLGAQGNAQRDGFAPQAAQRSARSSRPATRRPSGRRAGSGAAGALVGILSALGTLLAALARLIVRGLGALGRGIVAFARFAVPFCRRHPKQVLAGAGVVAVVVTVLSVRGCIAAERRDAYNASTLAGAQQEAQALAVSVTDLATDLVEPTSTPKDQWKQGEMPYLYQIDAQWSHETYSNGRLRHQGCGPTALTMVYIELTGNTDMDPAAMAEFSTKNGFSTDQDGTSWSIMTDGAAMLGLEGTQISPNEAKVRAALEAGQPVIFLMSPGHFTSSGHFIAVEKLDDDGKAVVHDSNSWVRSNKTWDLSTVCSEATTAWTFTLAE